MTGFVHPNDTYSSLSDVNLIDATRFLGQSPIRRQWLIEELQQQRSVHAIMRHENDRVVGMVSNDEAQRVCTARDQLLK
jgi:hypothetical protein